MRTELEIVREERRQKTFSTLHILDTLPESEFDELVELAATICGMPVGRISLVDGRREWFKSVFGMTQRESPIELSFCAHAILQPDVFVVEDAAQDSRFAENSQVTAEGGIRFYAGVPLVMENGCPIGTLCVIDDKPRKLSAEQTKALQILSRQVEARMEMRAQRMKLEVSLHHEQELAASLRSSAESFRAFMNNSPHLNYIKDVDGRLLFYNLAFAQQLGVTMEECLGKLDHELWPANQASVFRKHDLEVIAGGVRVEFDENLTNRFGELIIFRSTKFPYSDRDGRKLLAGISVDVTEDISRRADLLRSQAEVEAANVLLRKLSVTDGLTGLKNRRAFDQRLEIEFALARRVGRDLSVIMIDVDNFKRINDQRGHGAGDDVLREISRLLEGTVRLADLAVRYGGEEFAVLLPDSNITQAVRCAERLREALKAGRFEFEAVTVSIGVAGLADGKTAAELVDRADEALYRAKRAGKDRVLSYAPRSSDAGLVAKST